MLDNGFLDYLVTSHKNNGVLIDTNLLILLIVGIFNPKRISNFKKLRSHGYTETDFLNLKNLITPFLKIYITPQILAELSNLTFGSHGLQDQQFQDYFGSVVSVLKRVKENYVEKDRLLSSRFLQNFGFTDSSIIDIGSKLGILVITDDLELYGLLNGLKIDCININHLRF